MIHGFRLFGLSGDCRGESGGVPWVFLLLFFLFSLIFFDLKLAYGQFRGPQLQRDYSLTGSINLFYEQLWGDRSEAVSRFTHNYNLNLSGFITDPRIVQFTLGGSFSQVLSSNEATYNYYLLSVSTTFLASRPVRGALRFFPQPIELRYSYSQGRDSEWQMYGFSFDYDTKILKTSVPAKPRYGAGPGADKKGEETGFVLPVIYFDYDHFSSQVGDRSVDTDHLNVRAEGVGRNWYYTAEYDYRKYNDFSTQFGEVEVDYHSYNKEKLSKLDIYNRLTLVESQGQESLYFSNSTTWQKNLGANKQDLLTVSGGANYDLIGDIHSYRLGVSSSYNKYFSDRFVNYSSVGFGYGKNNDRTEHEESVGNSLTYLITPNLLLNNSLLAANRKDGYYFDGSIGLTLTTRRTWTWVGYEFTADSFEETKLQKHRFNLSAGADMLRNLSILAESAYEIEDTDSFGASYQEKTITLRTEMFWRVSVFSITAGVNYIKTTSPLAFADRAVTVWRGTLSAPLMRNMSLQVFAYLQQETGNDVFFVNPAVFWSFRKVSMSANYVLRSEKGTDRNVTEHRFDIRLIRAIDQRIRKFL